MGVRMLEGEKCASFVMGVRMSEGRYRKEKVFYLCQEEVAVCPVFTITVAWCSI
jgi:hypothetical protein